MLYSEVVQCTRTTMNMGKNMKFDYKKCHRNAILIVCVSFVQKNTMVNAVDV